MPYLILDSDPAALLRLGNPQAEVVTQDSLIQSAMRLDVLVGRDDREERFHHSRDLRAQTRRVGAAFTVRVRAAPVAVEVIRLPGVVVAERRQMGVDVLHVRQVFAVLEYLVELAPDQLPVLLDALRPGELGDVEERCVTDKRRTPDERLQRLEAENSAPDGRNSAPDGIADCARPHHGRASPLYFLA